MNAKTSFTNPFVHNLSLAAVAATLVLFSAGCGAAPDGDPATTSTIADQTDDAGAPDALPNSFWIPATPFEPDPIPPHGGSGGGSGGGGAGGSGGGGGGTGGGVQRRQ